MVRRKPSPTRPTTKNALSPVRRRLLKLMQDVGFGRIENLQVRHREPVFDPAPRVVRDVVLGKKNGPHAARDRDDFALKDAVIELFELFDEAGSTTVERIVVQHGLPLRVELEQAA